MASRAEPAQLALRHRWWRSYAGYVSALRLSERVRWSALVLLSGLIALGQWHWGATIPAFSYAPVLILGGLFLSPRPLAGLFGWVGVCVLAGLYFVGADTVRTTMAVLAVGVTMGAMYVFARARDEVGTLGIGSELMLRDLQRRHGSLADLPPLPQGWHAEAAIAGAHGDPFAGDALLCAEGYTNRHLEYCLIDVSGKGSRAGARALTTASALSGLLGQVEPTRFLPAANSYLVRQKWGEGFATAVHLELEPSSGQFSLSGAGHPPAMHFQMASGRWSRVAQTSGPALGLMNEVPFPRVSGQLAPGDALLLYTDGVIESRDNELADGIDWMGGLAERAMNAGTFAGLAEELVADARGGTEDDRTVLVVWRHW